MTTVKKLFDLPLVDVVVTLEKTFCQVSIARLAVDEIQAERCRRHLRRVGARQHSTGWLNRVAGVRLLVRLSASPWSGRPLLVRDILRNKIEATGEGVKWQDYVARVEEHRRTSV
jgi:hypothetical protein